MRAVVYSENGGTDVLRLVEREAPEPGRGEVRVRIVRSGVNPTDWKVRSGASAQIAFDEVVPHLDGGGVVDMVGDGVPDLRVDDRVVVVMATAGRPTGTAQEYVVLPADRVHPLPDGASLDVAADVGVPAITAHRALTTSEDGPTRLAPGALEGRTVLVAGGAGAVGNAAIQLAVWAGATVVTTVSSPAKGSLATAAGAQHVDDYRTEDVVTRVREISPDGVDVVVEVAPAQNLDLDLQVIRQRGTIAIYANNGGDEVALELRATFSTNARLQFVFLYEVGSAAIRAGLEDVVAAIADGAFGVGEEHGLPLTHFALEQTAQAQQAVEDGAVGKVLVDVAEE